MKAIKIQIAFASAFIAAVLLGVYFFPPSSSGDDSVAGVQNKIEKATGRSTPQAATNPTIKLGGGPHNKIETSPALLGGNSLLNPLALKTLNLTDDELIGLQKRIDSMNQEMSLLLKAHAKADPLRTDLGKGMTAYRISAFPHEGGEVFAKFNKECASFIGQTKADYISSHYPRELFYGNFGCNEMLVSFSDVQRPVPLPSAIEISIEEFDPQSGKSLKTRTGVSDYLMRFLGSAFSVQDSPSK